MRLVLPSPPSGPEKLHFFGENYQAPLLNPREKVLKDPHRRWTSVLGDVKEGETLRLIPKKCKGEGHS